MYRSRSLLLKAGKSFTADVSKGTKDAVKGAVAMNDIGASQHDGKIPKARQSSFPYVLLHHHKHPDLLQYRVPGSFDYVVHHVSSAASAAVSLITSHDSRERFLRLTGGVKKTEDKGIIKSAIVSQSDMGILQVLSLFQDLNSPLYESAKFQFDIEEFLDGCGFALGQFHQIKDDLLPELMNGVGDGRVDSNADSDEEDDEKDEREQPKPEYNFLDAAAKDPDSKESVLVSMTTPEMLEHIKMEGITRLVVGGMIGGGEATPPPAAIVRDASEAKGLREHHAKGGGARPSTEGTKVTNVALLGARVEEIYPHPEPRRRGDDDDPDAPMVDVSLSPLRDHEYGPAQVVTQLEVLYELEQSSINDDGKTHTQTSVMVGKFEACLDGDPNKGDDLQWRLCSYRPAVEFGYFNSW